MRRDLEKLGLSLEEVLKVAMPYDEIILEDKIYFERVEITVPHLTLIGRKNTKISYGLSNGTLLPKFLGGDGVKTCGTTGSATFIVRKEAVGFTALNITFENSFDRLGKENGQAVAFKSECSELYLKNCCFLGYQDTLYIDFGKKNIVENCKIYGDVDFIFGSADCLFKNCQITALPSKGDYAYYIAPSTYISNQEGFVFMDCDFYNENEKTYLGRPWYPSLATEEVYPRVRFIRSRIPEGVYLYLKRMHKNDPSSYLFQIEDCRIE